MAVSVRFHHEDPWERIRLISAAMPNTPLSMITPGMRFISWVPADEDVMRAVVQARGAQRDPPLPDRRPVERPGPAAARGGDGQAEGIEEVVIGLTYSISDVHTHAYYARARGGAGRLRATWTVCT